MPLLINSVIQIGKMNVIKMVIFNLLIRDGEIRNSNGINSNFQKPLEWKFLAALVLNLENSDFGIVSDLVFRVSNF
jgi:hypothetical protein